VRQIQHAPPRTISPAATSIDTNANVIVNGAANCIDWLQDGTGSAFRSDVAKKNNTPSAGGDESFCQGTKEDAADSTVVSGSSRRTRAI
jgi:hypothetical protein